MICKFNNNVDRKVRIMSTLITAMRGRTNFTRTENGAITYSSSLNNTLDFYANAGAKRKDQTGALSLFQLAVAENPTTAILALFHVGDVRGGAGERDIFKNCLSYVAEHYTEEFLKVLPLIPEYTRWDRMFHLIDHPKVGKAIAKLIISQLEADSTSKTPSLLAKWMPSRGKSEKSIAKFQKMLRALGFYQKYITPDTAEAVYRKSIASIRRKIKLVETAMSEGDWESIDFSKVPSRASMIYRGAFMKRQKERYEAFIAKVNKGEAKINASVLYPYEILAKSKYSKDETMEALWKNLPDYIEDGNTRPLVMADTSGSMSGSPVAGNGATSVYPLDVAISLALYTAERLTGPFKDHFMTFSSAPKLQRVLGKSLYEKYANLSKAHWGMSTNLQAAVNLILDSALNNNVSEDEMPTHLIIISDMEFNACTGRTTNLGDIRVKYESAGYEMPTIVFWNVQSRNTQVPAKFNDQNTYLVSGLSPAIFKSVLTAKATTPEELMLEVLNGERYAPLREALIN